MLEFFIVFTIAGFIIGIVSDSNSNAMAIILVISILWLFAFGAWAIATFIELFLGYTLAKKYLTTNKE